MTQSTPLWQPTQKQVEATKLHHFTQQASSIAKSKLDSYQDLWRWSITSKEEFWNLVWDYCAIVGDKGQKVFSPAAHLNQTQWFADAKLNYAENLLKHAADNPDAQAIVYWGEDQVKQSLSNSELSRAVARCQLALKNLGVQSGDRVAGYLPNSPYAVVAMLATTSLGAIWSSASPDFGIEGVVDRFGQIEPKVMFCTDGYFYGGKWLDVNSKNQAAAKAIESLMQVVVCPYMQTVLNDSELKSTAKVELLKGYANSVLWQDFLNVDAPTTPSYVRVEFNHPLFIMFSSGTTGVPKCIVHSVGGALIQHLKEHQLHADVRQGDKLFYFTTCGWMMWNWLVSALASGATLLLYDGNPFAANQTLLFDFADAEQMTHFGTSAKYLEACNKAQLNPAETHKLTQLRVVMSTGSPLAPAGFRYVYEHIKDDVVLSSISGGTDILSCFTLGNPTLPVYIGELQCLGLGMAVNVYDDDGQPLKQGKGDLVCTESFPSMPIGFWGDTTGRKYHEAYFDRFDNVWCHGDYVELTPQGGMIIHGRSDAVLNPGGVRIGTAEIYRQVETIEEVLESVVIGQQWEDDVRVVLFVVLRNGQQLDEPLITKIKQQIRAKTTPRHVPAKIIQVHDIPRTKSGKIVELAVRNAVHGQAIKNLNSLANPEALEEFKNRAELT